MSDLPPVNDDDSCTKIPFIKWIPSYHFGSEANVVRPIKESRRKKYDEIANKTSFTLHIITLSMAAYSYFVHVKYRRMNNKRQSKRREKKTTRTNPKRQMYNNYYILWYFPRRMIRSGLGSCLLRFSFSF